MKKTIFLLVVIVGLLSCNNPPKPGDEITRSKMDTRQTDISNSRSNETLQIEGRQGIQMIIPTFKFYIKDWSIEEVIWISDNEIAFETYEERRSTENENKLKYNYYKTKVME